MSEERKKYVVMKAHAGRIKDKRIIEGTFEEIVKEVAKELLMNDWLPSFSDFMVLRDSVEVKIKASSPKDVLSKYREYNLKRTEEKDTLSAQLPVYLIVYESLKITEEDYHDRGVAIVAPYIREEDLELISELLVETTKKPSIEELEQKIEIDEDIEEE